MKQILAVSCALLILSCSRSATPTTVDLVPSRDRVLAPGDSERVVTSWRPLGLSFPASRSAILYGLLIEDAPLLDAGHKPSGGALAGGTRVSVNDATAWERTGREYHRWYQVREEGAGIREGWVDSSSVALITVSRGDRSAGFLERKISIAGGDSDYNVLVLCEGTAVSLLDTSALVFADSFHPSGVTGISIEDVNADGVLETVVQAETIVSFQFLGASPLAWEAWLREKGGSWGAIFRYNISYGTDQGNSYTASRRVFSSTGKGLLDTVKVTTDITEAAARGEFRTTIVTFHLWNGSAYREDKNRELPQEGRSTAAAALLADPRAGSASVQALHEGDTLYVFDRGDTQESLAGQTGFWLHATSRSGKDGWIHSSQVRLSKIDPLKVNREVFLGRSGLTPAPQATPASLTSPLSP